MDLLDIQKTFPPGTVVVTVCAIVFLTCGGLVDELLPCGAMANHLVDGAPVGEASNVAVIDEDIGVELAAELIIVFECLFRVVTIDGIEFDASFATPVDGIVKQFAFTNRPQNQLVMVGNEHPQRLDGKRSLFANRRIAVLNDGAVKIYCNYHGSNDFTS